MNKKLFALIVVLCIALLTACGKEQPKETETDVSVAVATPQPAEESVYGLADNPFDDGFTEESASQPTTSPASKPQVKPEIQPEASNEPQHENDPDVKPESTPAPKPVAPAETPLTEYEKYQNMSAEEQLAYMNSFASIEQYFEWYNAAKDEYEAQIPVIDVGNGPIDMSQFFEESGN